MLRTLFLLYSNETITAYYADGHGNGMDCVYHGLEVGWGGRAFLVVLYLLFADYEIHLHWN